ncbi:MAG TPA: F0F1 ATP synthase subunit epsilon [Rhodospirillaceae bacterium]|nr:F0F1 ATP synthase subunit epsilon [Rhodospirillaceae bacterium]HAA93609.1 F0F1 ATP synthase subunit epsilon [Rhodospirillaceae bacterium]HAT35994.1 F0F1 ATP synthase subunit epsilon [Rhodospirillaceae bacterium]
MADALKLELVSPERLILSEEVEMAVLPGGEGDFGVLGGHSPVISTLRPGTISVFEAGTVKTRIFVAGGFAEVNFEGCTVLAEEAENVEEIDRDAVAQALSAAEEDLRDAEDEASRELAARQVETASAKLEAIDSPAYA